MSAWGVGRWDQLFTGWELREHRERQEEIERRAAFDNQLAKLLNAMADPLAVAQLDRIAAAECRRRTVLPELRERTRPLWPAT